VISCIAYLDGKAAGAGSLQSARGAGELVGIATISEQRRWGVASAVSAELAGAHFTFGGELAWLTAGDASAEAVYRGIGFRATGAHQICFEEVPT
jgi:predicted GNAT family acetyltransferase